MNNEILQWVITVVGASGIVGTIITAVIKKQLEKQYEVMERREKLRDDNMFLMMERVDNCAEMTHMMAKKLHDAGIINGDLQELDDKNKELNGKYNDHLRSLALEVLNK
jgi:hypothetical protein